MNDESFSFTISQTRRMKGAATSLPSIGRASESVVEGGLILSCSGRHAGIKYPADQQSTFSPRQRTLLALIAYGNFWVAACVSLQAPFSRTRRKKRELQLFMD